MRENKSDAVELQQDVTLFTPHLRLNTKKFFQIEHHDQKTAAHGGGMKTNVTVSGFYSDTCAQDVYAFAQNRIDTLGVRTTDLATRVMM